MSLLMEAFESLPVFHTTDDPDLFRACALDALEEFREFLLQYYTEGTLCRLVQSHEDPKTRMAAAVALGLTGTMISNDSLAQALRDPDENVRSSATDALWDIWFRGDDEVQGTALRRIMALTDDAQRTDAYEALLSEHASFAEGYNQRAIHYFTCGEYSKAVSDCQTALRLNPHHFGAAAGLGKCYMHMQKPGAALRAFAQALEINPDLNHLREVLDVLKAKLNRD